MNRSRRKRGYFVTKVDIAKAYDMVSWEFLNKVLIEAKIHDNLKNINMNAISSVSMSILWKGQNEAYFDTRK